MKLLKILIFKVSIVLTLIPVTGGSQSIYVRSGIYDFTDNTAREFYNLAVSISAGADIWNPGRLHLNISSGLAFNSVKYNGHRHNLYMIPAIVAMNYDLVNSKSKVNPTIGMGMIFMGKIDQNTDFSRTFLALTYGYHATGGLRIFLKKNLFLTIDLSYNLLLPPDSEEINISGLMTMVGLGIPISRK
jgi:outer membrane protein W